MATTTQFMTAEELERQGTPDGLWEVINGELVAVSPTGGEHTNIVTTLIYCLGNHVMPRRLGTLLHPDSGVVIAEHPLTVRVPDVGFIRADRLPLDQVPRGFFRTVPDLVVEVRSREDPWQEFVARGTMWLDAGAALVWLIDPATETVTEIGPDRVPHERRREDTLEPSDILPGFRLPVAELFAF